MSQVLESVRPTLREGIEIQEIFVSSVRWGRVFETFILETSTDLTLEIPIGAGLVSIGKNSLVLRDQKILEIWHSDSQPHRLLKYSKNTNSFLFSYIDTTLSPDEEGSYDHHRLEVWAYSEEHAWEIAKATYPHCAFALISQPESTPVIDEEF